MLGGWKKNVRIVGMDVITMLRKYIMKSVRFIKHRFEQTNIIFEPDNRHRIIVHG